MTGSTWHIGRSFGDGRWIEDTCPCPKEPCGLVARPAATCDHHGPHATQTIRQAHAPEDCPGRRPA